MRTIIIEDEVNARSSLKKMLAIIAPEIEIIAESGYISEAKNLIILKKPALVFIDIELEDGNCFEMLNQLSNIDFKIIFTTAYNEFAIKAFKFSAIDYLLKPIDPTELEDAINRAALEVNKESLYQEQLAVLKSNLNQNQEKLILKTSDHRYIISTKDIIRLEADTAYTIFYTLTQSITMSKNLKFYQSILGNNFIRCHQSHLVNINQIQSVYKNESLRMTNGSLIPIASRKKKDVLNLIRHL